MHVIDWIKIHSPGKIQDHGDYISISHTNGDVSTLWKNSSRVRAVALDRLDGFYDTFIGADLFSSTFKLASIGDRLFVNGVCIVPNLSDLTTAASNDGVKEMSNSIPFMYQAGIGYYLFCSESQLIIEWDTECRQISQEFECITDVLAEWYEAVN